MELEGSRSYDSLPNEIILYIFSLLPLDYCVFRLKCVCKAWSVLISVDFGALHLKRLRETSRGIICLHTERDISGCTTSFVIRSLQVGGGFKTLITKKISASNNIPNCHPKIYSVDGLICLRCWHDFHVINPTIGEFVTLPVLSYPCPWNVISSGFGYCPLTKQYKVLNIFRFGDLYERNPVSEVKAAIITVDHLNSLWRIIDIPLSCLSSSEETIYINGSLYWFNHSKYHITAFNVSDETFQEIIIPPQVSLDSAEHEEASLGLAEHEEGRLCLVESVGSPGENLDIYIMLENHQWEFRFRVLFEDIREDFRKHCADDLYLEIFEGFREHFRQHGADDLNPEIVSCLKIGKILVYLNVAHLQKWYLYDIKSKALEFVELGSSYPNFWFKCVSPFE